jgi:hypothetical protein
MCRDARRRPNTVLETTPSYILKVQCGFFALLSTGFWEKIGGNLEGKMALGKEDFGG